MHAGVSLIALALGYKVLLEANKEKKSVKMLGQLVAVLVMLGAALSLVCGAMKCSYMKGQCPFTGKSYGPMTVDKADKY